ncbi:MAG: hypothetical protein LRZ85_09095 [Alphaproteobacteria bacterium]|nr:hypothetical protein [Alphaproteobacteria bacterium]MCD8519725.1 hypothetical protein [Alphaproteobacteria bacterium]
MKKSIAAAVAALSAIFAISTDVNAQGVQLPCGPTKNVMQTLDRLDEKAIAIGRLHSMDGALGEQYITYMNILQRAGALQEMPERAYFHLHADKALGSWSLIISNDKGVSCSIASGEDMKIQSAFSRAPGIPVALYKWPTELEKKEYELTWSKNGGQGLQWTSMFTLTDLKTGLPVGERELRIYANTENGHFTFLMHDPATGDIETVAEGDMFPSLEAVEASVRKTDEQKLARPAAPNAPAPEVIPQ